MHIRKRLAIYKALRKIGIPHGIALWIVKKTTRPTRIVVEHGWVRDSANKEG